MPSELSGLPVSPNSVFLMSRPRQRSLRQASHRVLAKALRSHKVSHARVNKGIEIVCVTAYNAAIEGLEASAGLDGHAKQQASKCGTATQFLDTIVVIWQESPSVSILTGKLVRGC